MSQGASSRIVGYIYNVLVCQFFLLNYLPNRGGATVLSGIKVATQQYLGRVGVACQTGDKGPTTALNQQNCCYVSNVGLILVPCTFKKKK